jgi:hypothetical protein
MRQSFSMFAFAAPRRYAPPPTPLALIVQFFTLTTTRALIGFAA